MDVGAIMGLNSSYQINKKLVEFTKDMELSFLLTFLIEQSSQSKRLINGGREWFEFPASVLDKTFGVSLYRQVGMLEKLEKMGFILSQNLSFPAKRHICIDSQRLSEVLLGVQLSSFSVIKKLDNCGNEVYQKQRNLITVKPPKKTHFLPENAEKDPILTQKCQFPIASETGIYPEKKLKAHIYTTLSCISQEVDEKKFIFSSKTDLAESQQESACAYDVEGAQAPIQEYEYFVKIETLNLNETKKIKSKNVTEKNTEMRESAVRIIEHLNASRGLSRGFSTKGPGSEKNIGYCLGLLRQKYTEVEIIDMIDLKVWDWKGNKEMEKYLQPVTLFKRHGERYIEQARMAKDNPQILDSIQVRKGERQNIMDSEMMKGVAERLKNF